jgi:hypothetical protein
MKLSGFLRVLHVPRNRLGRHCLVHSNGTHISLHRSPCDSDNFGGRLCSAVDDFGSPSLTPRVLNLWATLRSLLVLKTCGRIGRETSELFTASAALGNTLPSQRFCRAVDARPRSGTKLPHTGEVEPLQSLERFLLKEAHSLRQRRSLHTPLA